MTAEAPTALGGRAIDVAARWVAAGRRLEMQGIAEELGVSRVTLFRNVGSREELLGEALWRVTEQALITALGRAEAERPEGGLHTIGAGQQMNALVSRSAPLHRLLEVEPALTIRVLTDPRGRVQPGVIAFFEALLRRDMDELGYEPVADPADLAYALVRLGESFLYADVLAARTPDVATADRLQRALVESMWPPPTVARRPVRRVRQGARS